MDSAKDGERYGEQVAHSAKDVWLQYMIRRLLMPCGPAADLAFIASTLPTWRRTVSRGMYAASMHVLDKSVSQRGLMLRCTVGSPVSK